MFVFNRSVLTVLLPLALLAGVAFWSNHSSGGAAATVPHQDARVAAVVTDSRHSE